VTDHSEIVDVICKAAERELGEIAAALRRIDSKVEPKASGPFGPGRSSAEIGDLMGALAKAQGSMGPVVKDAQNPHFRSTYATLASAVAAARDALSAHGIAALQSLDLDEASGMLSCSTVLAHGAQWVRTTTTVPVAKRDAQGIGSAATYARRYGLLAILGLAPEDDDDGNATGRSVPAPVETRAPPKARKPKPDKSPSFAEQVENAESMAELEMLAIAIKDLPAAEREAIKPIYRDRLSALRAGGAA
jgi:hypothetical protein